MISTHQMIHNNYDFVQIVQMLPTDYYNRLKYEYITTYITIKPPTQSVMF